MSEIAEGDDSRHLEIFIVDDDPSVRQVLSSIFSAAGFRVTGFIDGPSFVDAARKRRPAGVILDVYLPGPSGLEILRDIDAPRFGAPIFLASARSDIPTAVEAIKLGAYDFLEKRLGPTSLVERMRVAIERQSRSKEVIGENERRQFPGHERLTPRERAVLERIVEGASNQLAADELGISRRTVEVHRAHILAKLGAKNGADLVRIVLNRGRPYA